ncbi:lysosomal alpha-mannosidase, partial [Caerostris extrusa]
VHRRLLHDDAFGVGEALNESAFGQGLVVAGSHFLSFGNITSAASKHRPLAQQLYMQPQMSFAPYTGTEADYFKSYKVVSPGLRTVLPPNVHLLTLEPWKKGTVLIRLEHIYEYDEDSVLSKPVDVSLKGALLGGLCLFSTVTLSPLTDLHQIAVTMHQNLERRLSLFPPSSSSPMKKIASNCYYNAKKEFLTYFTDFNVVSLEETTLSANQFLKEARRLCWKIDGAKDVCGNSTTQGRQKLSAVNDDLTVRLGPMEIRTFIAQVTY